MRPQRFWLPTLWVLFFGCGGLPVRLKDAPAKDCATSLAEAPSLRGDPDYQDQPSNLRMSYEEHLAGCELSLNNPDKALRLLEPWERSWGVEARRIAVTALAMKGEDDRVKAVLERSSRHGEDDVNLFLFAPELRKYQGQDWFVQAGIRAWSTSKEQPLPRLLLALTGKGLLKFSVAWADKARPPGEFVFWPGKVKDARLDRERNRTILIVEGADMVDVQLEQLELTHIDLQKTSSGVRMKPTFGSSKEEIKVMELNGHEFSVELVGINEAAVDLSYIRVLGVYDGHDGQRPTVKGHHLFSLMLRGR